MNSEKYLPQPYPPKLHHNGSRAQGAEVAAVPQSKLAWAVVLIFIATTAAMTMGAPGLLRYAFPAGAFGVAAWLYFKAPLFYFSFTWWLWFLTPFLTRLVDYQTRFDELRLMQVASFLASLITVHTVVKEMPRSLRHGGMPFILAMVAVVYGTLVGFVQTSPVSVARGVLDWLTPICWGFYIFVQWRDYPAYRQVIQKTFLWSVLITGSYGIYQYLVAPEWDRFWLTSTKLLASGKPEPLGMRVWSTMASPGPFAVATMAGLLLLFSGQGILRIPAAVVGYLSFLLSLVRSAWGGWIVAIITFGVALKSKLQIRFFVTVIAIAVCVMPLATIEPFATTINDRLQTITSLEGDHSARQRQEIYREQLTEALSKTLGNGVGNTFIVKDGEITKVVIDSGILDFFFTLGWFGGLFYLSGLLMLLYELFRPAALVDDPFVAVSRAIAVGCLATLPYGSGMLAADGIVLWGFIGMSLAARKYHNL
jgi:hypothetical protein